MPPTTFPFKRSIIQRRIRISGTIVVLAVIYLALADWSLRHRIDLVAPVVLALYALRLIRDLARLAQPPAVMIGDDQGINDPALGRASIPWTAIREIRVSNPGGLGGQLFLIAKSAALEATPGSLVLRVANWARGARAGKEGADMVLAMTPVVALEASLDEILADIRSRAIAALIPIVSGRG